MQYVRKTVNDFRLRWNNYKDNNRKYLRKESCIQQHLFDYLNTSEARVTLVFWMTPPLTLFIKRILKILTTGNTTGEIHFKQWHLKG